MLSVINNGQKVATIQMRGLNSHAQFLVTSNPAGGSNISLSD